MIRVELAFSYVLLVWYRHMFRNIFSLTRVMSDPLYISILPIYDRMTRNSTLVLNETTVTLKFLNYLLLYHFIIRYLYHI